MIDGFTGMLPRVDFLLRQRQILEEIFGKDWFLMASKNERLHPAYLRWELCQTLIDQGGTISGRQLFELGKIALDTYYFLLLSSGEVEGLQLGLFDHIGDEAVRKHIRSRVHDPDFYQALVVQLYVAAWHKARRDRISLIERDGWPDVLVNLDLPNIPMLIECKHLGSAPQPSHNSQKNRIEKIVKKANNQIKHAKQALGHGHCVGILVLDVSSVVPQIWADPTGVPPRVEEVADLVQGALAGDKNTSIHQAIIVWDEYQLEVRDESVFVYECSRRTIRVHHTQPVEIFPENIPSHVKQVFYSSISEHLLSDYRFQVLAQRDTRYQ